MSHVLIVDDEPSICWGFEQFLTEEGHDVAVAACAEDALELVEQKRPDAIVLDVRLPGMDGLTAMRAFRKRCSDVPIIIITAHGDLETAVKAVREGAFDYLPKPFDLNQAADVVQRALNRDGAGGAQDEPLGDAPVLSDSLIGRSAAMQNVFKQIALVAPSDVPVLLTGESGTGKDIVARAIHQHSHRAQRPFLPVCLAALSPGLVESELFGHVKGAFTGAVENRTGLLELADGGTVLLDEIAETAPVLQVKLLRALEQREITPVGDAQPRPVNVRIIAATNRSLSDAIRSGAFREDLYFRLSVFRIHLPPLRDRVEDIPHLAASFLRICQPERRDAELSSDVIAELQSRQWPGNVRELRNAIEHAAVLARGEALRADHLPAAEAAMFARPQSADSELSASVAAWLAVQLDSRDGDNEPAELYEQFLELCEPALLKSVLEHCKDHKARAAELLGMHRTTLRQKLRKYGMDEEPAAN